MITMKICDSRQLHGRTAEESILLNSYFASLSLCSSSSPSTPSSLSGDSSNASIILICGDSGVGKSKIAETLKPHVIEDDGYFLRGKFDQLSYFCGDVCSEISGGASSENHSSYSTLKNSNSPHIPYSGIASAFSDYCDQLERRGPDDWKEVTDKLRAVIKKEEGRVLYEAIPALKKILTCDNLHDADDEEQDVTSNSSERLRRKSESSAVLQKKSRSFTLSTTLSSNSLFRNLHDQEEEKERSDTSINHEEDDFQSESRSHRLNYLMKKFIHAISTVGDPIVLLIDDMHWADPSSLELIRTLILGAKNPFTFLFTYRPVQPSHPFLQMIQDLQHTHVSKTEIQLRNLREESVRELVANLLSIDLRNERLIERKFRNVVKECEEVKDIGVEKEKSIIKASCNCCMGSRIKKIKSQGGSEPEDLSHPCTSLQRLTSAVCSITNGNPFFIRQQIICWIDQGLLRLDKKQHRWVWDIEKIRECTVSNDVVSMVSEKIRRLPESTQHALKICACIGSKIDLHILGLLLREIFLTQCDIDDNEILAEREIQCAIQEGLLVKSPDRTGVIFVHDSIQSAAYSLLDTDNQSSFHLQLGRLLETKLSPCIYQQHFFTIANQLARGYKLITEREERIDAMQIFLMAGEKSRAASAFPEAQFFFARGIFLIRDEVDWKDNYRMCIDCCSKAAEAAALTGDYEKMDEWLNIVLLRSKELDDQLRAYYIRVKALASQAEMEPAVDAGLEAMKLVGVKMPSRNVLMHTLFVLAKTRCLMKRKCVEDLLQLPPIEERHMIPALRLMNLISTLSASGKRTLCPLICFKSVQLNMKYGMTEGTPASIALYGALLLRFGFPITEAAKYSEMATTLQERLGYKETIANVTMLTYGIVFPFTKPLSECLKPLPDACMTGLEYGDVMHGLRCLSCYAWITYHSAGQPLPQFVNTIQRFSKYSIEYNSTSTLLALKVFVQVCANFMGSIGASHNPANLVGDHFDLDTVSSETPCKTHMLLLEQSQLMQIILGYFFGDYEKAWMASEKLRATGATSFAGLMFPYFLAFYRGLTALAQWDILKSRNFMKVAKSCLNEMKTGQKNSPINLSHSYYLLKAEYSVAKKRHGLAERFFSLSIRHAAEGKVLHEQALACERFGFYYLRRNNHEAAYEQIRAAYDLYRKWGGRAKSESLKKRFPHLADARRNHEVHINQKKTLS